MRRTHIHQRARKAPHLVPRWLRQRLKRPQQIDLGIVHMTNVHAVSTGEADEQVLWDMTHCVLAWSYVANRIDKGVPEMLPQLSLMTAMLDHYRDTGRIEFLSGQYELARVGTVVMDMLAETVDTVTAEEALIFANQVADGMRRGG